jgi:hypothetical protein
MLSPAAIRRDRLQPSALKCRSCSAIVTASITVSVGPPSFAFVGNVGTPPRRTDVERRRRAARPTLPASIPPMSSLSADSSLVAAFVDVDVVRVELK